MRHDNVKEELEKWMQRWDAVEKEFAKEQTPVKQTSYFTDTPSTDDYRADDYDDNWLSIYRRSADHNYSDNLLTDNNVPKIHNPVHFGSLGPDQQDEEGHVRVTPNFNDGESLRELDDLKRKVESMERRFHEADVFKKSDRKKIQEDLDSLRKRIHKLSEKIQSTPKNDLT